MEKIKDKIKKLLLINLRSKIDQKLNNDLIENIEKLGMEKSDIKKLLAKLKYSCFLNININLNDVLTSFQRTQI
jgi:hypothetical protein